MLSLTNSQRCCLAIQHFGAFRCVVHCIGALVLLCIAILVQFGASVHRRIALVHFGVQLTCVLVFDWLTVHRIGALWCTGELHWCILVSDWLTGQHQHWSEIPGLSQVLGRECHNWRWCRICIFSQQTILWSDISVIYCQNEKNKIDNQRRWKAFPLWAKR